jgi:phosphatidylglycerophosphatase A
MAMSLSDRARYLVITSCGLGLSPVAPGTVGTLGGVALAVLLQATLPGHVVAAWWITAGTLFALGCTTSAFVARTFPNEDPGAFVLDEVVGYLVTVAVYATLRGLPDATGHAVAFFMFRFFDVAKIQPARRLEDLPGAFGIMADDQVAGLYAGLATMGVITLFGW